MNRICIDARFWGIKHTGIGRYVEELIDNLPGEVELIVHPDQEHEPKLAKYKKYLAIQHPYSLASQFEMFGLLNNIKSDLVHFPHFFVPILWRGKYIVTIHDLIKHYSTSLSSTTRNPLVYFVKQLGYRLSIWNAINFSQNIIVPTNYWKKEIANHFNVSQDKIMVTYEAVSSKFKKGDLLKEKPFLLYVGNLYPHKNVPLLIQAAEKLKIKLKIVCARSVFENRLPKSDFVEYLGRVSDKDLTSLYKSALCFVFPSKIEGFGLMGLEAMTAGCPVLAANASCLPEVYGDAAIYFDPNDLNDLISKIKLIISDQKLRQILIAKGRLQVKKYSWTKMAKQTWEIYQNVLQ